MRILGIDTSSSSLSIAVTNERMLQSEYSINHRLTHSEQLMPSIDYLLDKLEYRPCDIDAIGVCVGPGSFTGIRIGIAAANAMALALKIPIVGISSLEAMAYSVSETQRTVFATLDAQRNRVYRGAYSFREGYRQLIAEDVIEVEQLYRELQEQEASILLGDGIFMMQTLPGNTVVAAKTRQYIRAAEVCLLVEHYLQKEQALSFVRPVYLRKSQAEIQFEEKLRNPQRYRWREMNEDNVEGAYEIEKKAFSHPWGRTDFFQELNNERAYYQVVEEIETKKVVAFAGFWKIFQEAHICNIAVHPDYRGLGIGHLIMKALLEKSDALGILELTLEVRASNETAKNLYRKYGFKISGIRKEYYTDNREDAVIMWCSRKRKEEFVSEEATADGE